MAVKVNCENRNAKRRIDLSKVKKIAGRTLRSLGKKDSELNIIFVSNQKIRALNRMYFGKDTATDVISFPAGKAKVWDAGRIGKHVPKFLGDIAISSDQAVRNSKEYGVTFIEELLLYVVHGTLHLLGYDDRTKKGRAAMQRKENEIVRRTKKIQK